MTDVLPRVTSIVVICTKDRPEQVRSACTAVARARPSAHVLVYDASQTSQTREVCSSISQDFPSLKLIYDEAERPGLARQRNDAVRHHVVGKFDIVHFIDDDTIVHDGYFDALESVLSDNPSVAGVGGVSEEYIHVRLARLKRMFALDGGTPGRVFRSGRPTHGQVLNSIGQGNVDWLAGASMSWRTSVFASHRFDDRMVGRSLAEDLCFSYAVSRMHELRVVPSARCLHAQLGSGEGDPRELARERFATFERWVRENVDDGLSLRWFWWSVIGELLLYGLSAIFFPQEVGTRKRALGLLDALRDHRRSVRR